MPTAHVICDPPPSHYFPGPPTTVPVYWPQQMVLPGPQPWQCPDCRLWNSPAVATHRCAEPQATDSAT